MLDFFSCHQQKFRIHFIIPFLALLDVFNAFISYYVPYFWLSSLLSARYSFLATKNLFFNTQNVNVRTTAFLCGDSRFSLFIQKSYDNVHCTLQ